MANKVRGEVEITLVGQTHTLRPSFEGLAEIEDKSGLDLLSLAIQLGERKTGIKKIVAVIYGGLKGAGSDLTFEQVGELVVDEGVTKLARPVAEFLGMALSGAQEKKEKPVPEGNPPAA